MQACILSALTPHCPVLDSSKGKPAAGVRVELQDVDVGPTLQLRATG
jgi:5-hydroxyisourate hydrolase-like protein (transthyretin family)